MNAQKKKESFVKVKALQLGYYGEERRRAGEIFVMKEKDFFVHDAKGKRVVETAIDEETGEEYQAYKTASWVDLIEENYDPNKDVEKPVAKKKVRIGPSEPVSTPPEPAKLEPASANPEGFAKSAKPVRAEDAAHVSDAAPTAKRVAVKPEGQEHAEAKPAAHKAAHKGDDVI